MVNASATSALQGSASGIDFWAIGKNVMFVGHYINDMFASLFTIIFQSFKLPYGNTQSSILLAIIYLIIFYIVVKVAEKKIKPIVKFSIAGLIIWLLIGFFKI